MPFTQSRAIELLNAGLDYQQAFNALCALIRRLQEDAESGKVTWEQAFIHASINATSGLLKRPGNAQATLAFESKHFRANKRHNDRARIKQEQKRRDAGVPARQQDTSILIDSAQPPILAGPIPAVVTIDHSRISSGDKAKIEQELLGVALKPLPAGAKLPAGLVDLSIDEGDPENLGDAMLPTGNDEVGS